MEIKVKKLHSDAIIPKRQTELASGMDLHALDVVSAKELGKPYDGRFTLYELEPGERVLVRTGLAVQMTEGMEAQVRPRSGLALRNGVTVLNSPGTIDSDFTSDIGVILANLGDKVFTIKKGDRIAQIVFQAVLHNVKLMETDSFENTARGVSGFGHTGQK